MWFFFGFISTLIFSIYNGYKRFYAGWHGDLVKIGLDEYEYKLVYRKTVFFGRGALIGLRISIKAYGDYDFVLKHETWFDRWCKYLGLVAEHQVGRDDFDKKIYIISDDPRFCNVLSSSSAVVDQLLRVFRSDIRKFCDLKEIRYHKEKFWLEYEISSGFKEETIHELAKEHFPRLAIVAAELTKAGQSIEKQRRDPFPLKASIILAISTGLTLNGLLQSWRLFSHGVPITIDKIAILKYSVPVTFLVVVSLIVAALYFLGRSSRTHLVILEIVFPGLLGVFLTSATEFRDINIEFDRNTPVFHDIRVRDKSMHRGRLYLDLDAWSGGNKAMTLQVPKEFYDATSVGDTLKIEEMPGYFGWRWIKSVELAR